MNEPTLQEENQLTSIKDDIKRFRLLPQLIISKKAHVYALENKKRSINQSMKMIENTIAKDIFFEKGEDGKSKFSNEKMREIELDLRSDSNFEIKKFKSELIEIEEKQFESKTELEGFELEYDCIKKIVAYFSRSDNFIIQRS